MPDAAPPPAPGLPAPGLPDPALDPARLGTEAEAPGPRWRWRPPAIDWRSKARWFGAEYLIVVLGVLTALGANAWWQARADTQTEARYLARLSEDLGATLDQFAAAQAFEVGQVEAGLVAYRALSAPTVPEADRQRVADALGVLSLRFTLALNDAAYRDLLATGNLSVIRDAALREQIVSVYEQGEAAVASLNLNTQTYVDEGYVPAVVLSGLVTPRVVRGIPGLERTEASLDSALAGGYRDAPSPLWSLPPQTPEWDAVRGSVLMRLRIARVAEGFVGGFAEQVRALQAAVDAEIVR